MFERVIVASGTSNRQTKALAASVRDSVRGRGLPILSTEGEDNGEWIIVDCGAAVVHIMQPAIRDYYHLEEIWGGKSVKMKLGDKATGLVKASEPEPAPARAARPAAKKAAPAKAAAGRASSGQAAAAKSAAGKTPGRKTGGAQTTPADARKAANRSAAFKRVSAASPARKGAAKSASPASRKTASKAAPRPAAKAPARKSSTRKA